jgi:arylformamidase
MDPSRIFGYDQRRSESERGMATLEKVFLDYSQDELDRAYDQGAWVPNIEALRLLTQTRSAAVRATFAHAEHRYGPTVDETLEILPTAQKGAPIVLFIHGGRWLAQPHNAFIHFADTIVNSGAHFVAARFAALPPTPGEIRMPTVVDQLRRAVVWLHQNAAGFGGDSARIHLIGHSSGAHLASVLLTTAWPAHGLPADAIKSGVCVSGMYELRPVLLSARSSYVVLSAAEEDEFSAIRHVDRITCPLLIAHGTAESPEFQRQAREFAAAVERSGRSARLLVVPGCNHFEINMALSDPASVMGHAALAHMGLARR